MSTGSIANDIGSFVPVRREGKVYIVDTLPQPRDLPDGSLLGYYSVTLPNKNKIVPYQYIRDWNGAIDTETSFTRMFLKSLGKRKVRGEEYRGYRLSRPPLYIRPGVIEEGVYIDIKQAYPSIYKYLGWQTDYVRGKYWGVGKPLHYPFPMAWKAGRSYVVSGARHLQYGRYIENGKVKIKKYLSQFSNPPLVSGVYDVLSMVARFSQYALKAYYWNVDGGIFHARAEEILLPFLESIGLTGAIKYRGHSVIMASGYWKVGDHKTVHYANNRASKFCSGDWIPMDKTEAEWVYKNFRTITENNK